MNNCMKGLSRVGFLSPAIMFLSVAAFSSPALAHSGTGLAGGFQAGFMHPLMGPDHLLAMVAVGLWGAFLGRPLVILLPVVFPTVMAMGGVAAMLGMPVPPVEIGIAVSVIVLGVAIAAAFVAPIWAACLLVGAFAVFHGYAHGLELPSAADPIGYSLGFVFATGMLHLVGIALGLARDVQGGDVALRSGGGLIAAAGVYFLWTALAA